MSVDTPSDVENYTVKHTVRDLGEHHRTTRGMYMLDSETGRTPWTTLADA
jgi:hypothetical protein